MDTWHEDKLRDIDKILQEVEINISKAVSTLYWLKGKFAMLEQNFETRLRKLEERQDPGKYNQTKQDELSYHNWEKK